VCFEILRKITEFGSNCSLQLIFMLFLRAF
jgi:hypothetical protein